MALTSLGRFLKIDSGLVMLGSVRRYAHVPLGGVILLLIVVVIAWLLERRVDGVWDPALRIAVPVPPAVTIAPSPSEVGPAVAATHEASTLPVTLGTEPDPIPRVEEPVRAAAVAPAEPAPQYVLESGPFTSSVVADRLEDQLSRLGYPTIRFRKQEVMRLYVVVATGFDSTQKARRAAAELGRGSVVEVDGAAQVLLDRATSLGEAIAVARPVRARGYEVRVEEKMAPAVIYHIRYGQFDTQAESEARREALAPLGVQSRVVKVE